MGFYIRQPDNSLLCVAGNISGGGSATLSKSSDGTNIILTRADGTKDIILDNDTTYTFTQVEYNLHIEGTDGTDITVPLGKDVTYDDIISALEYTPLDEDNYIDKDQIDALFAQAGEAGEITYTTTVSAITRAEVDTIFEE